MGTVGDVLEKGVADLKVREGQQQQQQQQKLELYSWGPNQRKAWDAPDPGQVVHPRLGSSNTHAAMSSRLVQQLHNHAGRRMPSCTGV